MNRRKQFETTLPRTLDAIKDLSAEVCILDWSSTDGLKPVEHPQVKWKRVSGHKFYYPSKCKNEAHRMGIGEYLVNLDADNWVTSAWLDKVLPNLDPMAVQWSGHSGCWGRIVIHRELFKRVGGYDEGMTGYGWQDSDLVLRAQALGAKIIETGNDGFLIHHDDLRNANRGSRAGFSATNRLNQKRSAQRIALGKFDWRTK